MNLSSEIFPEVLLGFIIAMALALFAAPIAIRIAWRLKLIDYPNRSAHKKHSTPTPMAGGLVIAIVFLIIVLIFSSYFSQKTMAIVVSSLIVFGFGLVDDARGLDAKWKFLGQFLGSGLVMYFGVRILIIDWFQPEVNAALNTIITIIWLVGLTNAFNLVDSADGLSLSLAGISSILYIFAAFVSSQWDLVFTAVCLLGMIIGLLYYNLRPARLFLGDSGAQTIGFFLGAIGILYNPIIFPQASSWFVPISLVFIPILDVGLVVFSRLRHRKPLFHADLRHTYHRLIERGMSDQRAIWTMAMGMLFSGAIGMLALYQDPLFANLIFALLCVSALLLLFMFEAQ